MKKAAEAATCRECGVPTKKENEKYCAACARWRDERDEYRLAWALTFEEVTR